MIFKKLAPIICFVIKHKKVNYHSFKILNNSVMVILSKLGFNNDIEVFIIEAWIQPRNVY